jgi:hypothetical protein
MTTLIDMAKGILVAVMAAAVYGLPKSVRGYILRRWGRRVRLARSNEHTA